MRKKILLEFLAELFTDSSGRCRINITKERLYAHRWQKNETLQCGRRCCAAPSGVARRRRLSGIVDATNDTTLSRCGLIMQSFIVTFSLSLLL